MLVFQGIDLINNPSLLDNAKSREKIKVLCDYSKCKGGKCITKHHVQTKLRRRRNGNMSGLYCSQDCAALARRTITIVPCAECKTPVRRQRHIRSRSDRRFCNSSCAASYNNKHKTHGYRRSKLEEHLEECLRAEYPNLELLCNNKEVIR